MFQYSFGIFFLICLMGCSTVVPWTVDHLTSQHQQAVYVKLTDKSRASLSLWQREARGWTRRRQCSAVVGRSGVAVEGKKREGDGFTPGGVFNLGPSFGYDPHIITGLDYVQVTDHDFWVDDVSSDDYNKWVKATHAKSFEVLRRSDNLYSMAAVINYNMNPIVPGNGSAIFLHIWRNYYHPTSGCVAVSARQMRQLLKQLRRQLNPVIIIER